MFQIEIPHKVVEQLETVEGRGSEGRSYVESIKECNTVAAARSK